MIIDTIKTDWIKTQDQLSIAGKIVKHFEHISMNFIEDFPLEKISNNDIKNLLDNIENRL